jgi:hypothetical protein
MFSLKKLAALFFLMTAAHSCLAITLSTTIETARQRLDKDRSVKDAFFSEKKVADDNGTLSDTDKVNVEKAILDRRRNVQAFCGLQRVALVNKKAAGEKKESHINAWGALVTLIGGVTGYAPAKTVLMGIGISANGGENSVLGGLATSVQEGNDLTQAQLDQLGKNFDEATKNFKDIDPASDPSGYKRYNALEDITAACLFLFAGEEPAAKP